MNRKDNFKSGFIKRAKEVGLTDKQADELFNNVQGLPPGSGYQMQHQSYMGQSPRRELNENEQAQVAKGKSSIISKIFPSLADSPAVKMHSPVTDAVGFGGLGGLAGGAAGSMFDGGGDDHTKSILGALLGGGLGAGYGYGKQNARNNDIEETMRHSPENSTLRHYYADPLVQKGKDREHEMAMAKLKAI